MARSGRCIEFGFKARSVAVRNFPLEPDLRARDFEIDRNLPPVRQLERFHLFGLANRSEEHTSELQSLMRISYAVFCLKKKIVITTRNNYKHVTFNILL